MFATVSSTFDGGADGWTIQGDVQSSGWSKTGGNPGGYYAWVDAATGQDSYYVAPKPFLGHRGVYLGGTLTYDILDSGHDYNTYDVQIQGDGNTLQYTNPYDKNFPKPGVWSAATVHLDAFAWIDTATGAAPSRTEMRDTLADLSQLIIRAEYVNGPETGGLDNVALAPPTRTTPADRLIQSSAAFDGGASVSALSLGRTSADLKDFGGAALASSHGVHLA